MPVCNLRWQTNESWLLEAGQICLRKITFWGNGRKKMLRWGTCQLCWQLMKHCILTVATLASNNTTPINLPSMICSTEVFVMSLYRTPTSAYHMRQTRNLWERYGEILYYRINGYSKHLVNGLSAHCKM